MECNNGLPNYFTLSSSTLPCTPIISPPQPSHSPLSLPSPTSLPPSIPFPHPFHPLSSQQLPFPPFFPWPLPFSTSVCQPPASLSTYPVCFGFSCTSFLFYFLFSINGFYYLSKKKERFGFWIVVMCARVTGNP